MGDAPEDREDSWPVDAPLPVSAAECVSLVRGEWVRWPGTIEQLAALPGRYEMIGGWICLKR